MTNSLARWVEHKFQRWLVKRVPRASKQTLSRRNIFIFPSRFGFSYLFFVLLLFILGTNYQNNLILLLSYLLASLFITAMIQSFNNLSQLTISTTKSKISDTKSHAGNATTTALSGFSGSCINVAIQLHSKKVRMAYQLFFQTNNQDQTHIQPTTHHCAVPITLNKRGLTQLPRLTLQSYYGLGLFRCWTQVDLNIAVIVYPKPERPAVPNIEQWLTENASAIEDNTPNELKTVNQKINDGVDEFNELAPYQRGESLTKVAWKHVARGQGWYTKNYDQHNHSTPNWLSLAALPKAPLEQQLRWLSYLIVELQKQDKTFGLVLNNITINPNNGVEHSHACLKEVALYGK